MTICDKITVTIWFTVNKTPAGVLLISLPPSPRSNGISMIFQLRSVPTGKKIFNKNGVAQYYYVYDTFFCVKVRKNLFILLIYILAGKGTF